MRSLPFPSLVAIIGGIIHRNVGSLDDLAIYLPPLATALGMMTALAVGNDKRLAASIGERTLGSERRWVLFQLSFFSLLFFAKGFVRVSVIHMALAIVPSVAIIGVTAWQLPRRFPGRRLLSSAAFACLLVVSFKPVLELFSRFASNITWIRDDSGLFDYVRRPVALAENTCFPSLGFERIRCFTISQEQIDAIRYIQKNSTEHEPIFVGLGRHDKIVMNNVLFYFLSNRGSATKWHQFDPGVQTTAKIQSEIIAELLMQPPRYVILNSQWDDVKEPNESANSSGVTILDEFIHANYRAVASFGATTILEYRGELGLKRGTSRERPRSYPVVWP
jgi:hypothetical protein